MAFPVPCDQLERRGTKCDRGTKPHVHWDLTGHCSSGFHTQCRAVYWGGQRTANCRCECHDGLKLGKRTVGQYVRNPDRTVSDAASRVLAPV